MERRKFLKGSALFSGLFALNPIDLVASSQNKKASNGKKAKNIIIMISDCTSSN